MIKMLKIFIIAYLLVVCLVWFTVGIDMALGR